MHAFTIKILLLTFLFVVAIITGDVERFASLNEDDHDHNGVFQFCPFTYGPRLKFQKIQGGYAHVHHISR